jgi:hypothetical protein
MRSLSLKVFQYVGLTVVVFQVEEKRPQGGNVTGSFGISEHELPLAFQVRDRPAQIRLAVPASLHGSVGESQGRALADECEGYGAIR